MGVVHEMMSVWQTLGEDPSVSDYEREFSRIWKAVPKVVFSTTLETVGENCRLVRGGLAAEAERLRQQPGGDIATCQQGRLTRQKGALTCQRVEISPGLLAFRVPDRRSASLAASPARRAGMVGTWVALLPTRSVAIPGTRNERNRHMVFPPKSLPSTSRSSWGSIDSQVHVANNFGRKIYVIVTPNPDWAWGDVAGMAVQVVAGAAFTALTAGTSAPAEAALVTESVTQISNLARGINSIKKAYDLIKQYTVFKSAMAAYKANSYFKKGATVAVAAEATALEKNVGDVVQKLKEFLQKSAYAIEPGAFKRVNDTSYLKFWNALNPSYWGSLAGCQTVQILIIDESMEQTCTFVTGADDSWIAAPDKIVRSKYGSIWQEDPAAGTYYWKNVVIYMDGYFKGASQTLAAGRYDLNQLTIGNDKLSSLRIPPGWKVTLYQQANFAGKSKVLTADTPYVGDEFNDSVSSIVVESPANRA